MLFKTATSRNIFSIVAVGVIATVATASTLFVMSYNETKASSIAKMTASAHASAAEIERRISTGMQTVYTMRDAMQAMAANRLGDRPAADRMLAEIKKNSPDLLGIWTGWEPDAFDGRDFAFAGKRAHDATGRYIPYVTSADGGRVQFTALEGYADPVDGAYYQLAFTQNKTVVLEPFHYDVNGVATLMTSLTTPLDMGGKVVGVAGADVALSDMSAMIDSMKPMETGYVALLSSGGSFVSHPNKDLLGKNVSGAVPEAETWRQLMQSRGDLVEYIDTDGVAQLAVAVPVNLPGDTVWTMVATVPQATVFAYLTDMAWTSGFVIAGASLLLILLGTMISRRFRNRLQRVISATGDLAGGRMDVDLRDANAKDEIGDMSRSLGVLRDAAIAKMRLEQEALENRNLSDQERAAREADKAREAANVQFAVDALADGLERLSQGDVAHRIATPFAGNLDTLRENFNASLEKLQAALREVGQNARTIDVGAAEVRNAADEMARRTEQQAASVEQTAAALTQVTATIKSSSERAQQAGDLVSRTKVDAEHSGEIVRDAVEAMREIEKSSNGITNIIGVIDEIAFQTGLLALNAGVEAARAGDAGRGFAVVAHEVRELAQRSATAAREIKVLINTSETKVRTGVDLVEQTGDALSRIVTQVQEIDHHVSAIATAAREQASGIDEISTAVTSIDQGTQQNAAMVEESTAASHGLARESAALNHLLTQFNLGEGGAPQLRAVSNDSGHVATRSSPARALGQKIADALGVRNAGAAANAAQAWKDF